MIAQALHDLLLLFATLDPIGSVAIFVPITAGRSIAERNRIASKAVYVAGAVLLAFLVLGEVTLTAMGVRLPSFQLAGGIVLFLFSLQMIFGDVTAHGKPETGPEPGHDIAVFPLALPVIASPGAILAVVMLTENHTHSLAQQALTGGILFLVLGMILGGFRLAGRIHHLIGHTGEAVAVRVVGLLLAALATEEAVQGIAALVKDGH